MIHQPTVRSSSIKIAADTCANAIFHPFMDHLLAKVSRWVKKKKRESLLNYRIIVVQYMLDLKQIFNSLESMSEYSLFFGIILIVIRIIVVSFLENKKKKAMEDWIQQSIRKRSKRCVRSFRDIVSKRRKMNYTAILLLSRQLLSNFIVIVTIIYRIFSSNFRSISLAYTSFPIRIYTVPQHYFRHVQAPIYSTLRNCRMHRAINKYTVFSFYRKQEAEERKFRSYSIATDRV